MSPTSSQLCRCRSRRPVLALGAFNMHLTCCLSHAQAKIGPPETHVHETQRYTAYQGGQNLVFELSTVALDVPYGDHFSVECRFDVTAIQVSIHAILVAIPVSVGFAES